MNSAIPSDPFLITEWTRAVVNVDLESIQQLHKLHPGLLCAPLDNIKTCLNADYAQLTFQLKQLGILGETLDNMTAIPFTMLDLTEGDGASSTANQKRLELIHYLLQHSPPEFLSTYTWGSCQNTLLHLAHFLGLLALAQSFVERGASPDTRNDLGFSASAIGPRLRQLNLKNLGDAPRRPNYASPDRFKELRKLAEGQADSQTTPTDITHEPLKGKASEQDLKQQSKKKDIALLAKRSPVKNNPLLKKMEQQQSASSLANSNSSKPKEANALLRVRDETSRPSRNSAVINSLKTKSCVSSSVFRQGEPEIVRRSPSPSPVPSLSKSSAPKAVVTPEADPLKTSTSTDQISLATPPDITQHSAETTRDSSPHSEPSTSHRADSNTGVTAASGVSNVNSATQYTGGHSEHLSENGNLHETLPPIEQHEHADERSVALSPDEAMQGRQSTETELSQRWSGSQNSHWSVRTITNNRISVEKEQWYDSSDNLGMLADKHPAMSASDNSVGVSEHDSQTMLSSASVVSHNEQHSESTPAMDLDRDSDVLFAEKVQTLCVSANEVYGSALHSDSEHASDGTSSFDTMSLASSDRSASFSAHRLSATAESVDTWPPPSSPYMTKTEVPDNVSEVVAEKPDVQSTASYGRAEIQSTSKYVSQKLPEKLNYENLLAPTTINLDLPVLQSLSENSSVRAFGKLYVRVREVDGLLLPIPKQATFVRCVVNDGHFEYMSRYEPLAPTTTFDYECIIDTQPDMVITISLHVRPDVHVKQKSGLSRLLTPVRKQREELAAYVHPEDGAFGQSRVALDQMIHACYQKTFANQYDCFNSWYVRSSRERQRQTYEEVLKVVGKLNVEVLYLPVSDPTLPIPGGMRECDLALRIRQWHNTCWQSGYMSVRRQNSKIWERHYCRLIGSQLLCYTSKETTSWKPVNGYDIADVIRLSAATDQVIVTLVDLPDKRIFGQHTICDDTGRGFFRLTFSDCYIDCVSDYAEESEDWVKILKSMIGRVPLKIPISV